MKATKKNRICCAYLVLGLGVEDVQQQPLGFAKNPGLCLLKEWFSWILKKKHSKSRQHSPIFASREIPCQPQIHHWHGRSPGSFDAVELPRSRPTTPVLIRSKTPMEKPTEQTESSIQEHDNQNTTNTFQLTFQQYPTAHNPCSGTCMAQPLRCFRHSSWLSSPTW